MTKIESKNKGNNAPETFPYDEFEAEAINRLQNGDSPVGSDSILTGLIQRIVNAALSGEADAHNRQLTTHNPQRTTGIKKIKMKCCYLPLVFLMILLISSCKNDPPANRGNGEEKPLTVPRFERDSAFAFVEMQLSFGPRVPNSTGHAQCREWLAGQFARFGMEVLEQPFSARAYHGETLNGTNIMARYRPELSKRILLAAHWDSRFQADSPLNTERVEQPIPGADDGGSGVAVLLEIARQLQGDSTDIGVDFLLFDAEDQGDDNDENPQPESWCLGAQHWSRNIIPAGYRPMYGILLDMVGAANATFPKEGVSMSYAPQVVDKVWKLGQSLGYSNYFVNTKGGPITDDHYFVNTIAQIPMIDIIHKTGNTATGFGAHWHTHDDDLEVIHVRTLKAVGQTLLELIYREAANRML